MNQAIARQALEDAWAIVAKTWADAMALPEDQRAGPLAIVAKIEPPIRQAAKELRIPLPWRVRFFSSARPSARFLLKLNVVHRRSGSPGEITWDGLDTIREAETRNGGLVPLTAEEFDAIAGKDEDRLVCLARDRHSNLHPLFVWDDGEAQSLQQHIRMHGDGN